MLHTHRFRSGLFLSIALGWIAVLFCSQAVSGNPDKDPNGWRKLTFGMSAAEVLKQLGQRIDAEEVQVPRSLMLDDEETPDLQSALALSRTLVENRKDVTDAKKLKAAETLLDLVKTRTWKGSKPPDLGGKAGPQLTVSGMLAEFSQKTYTHDFIQVRPRNARFEPVMVLTSSLDAKSAEHVALVKQTVFDLSEILMAEKREAVKAAQVDVDRIRLEGIKIRDITLIPSVRFANDELVEIRLSTPGAGSPLTLRNPNWHGMYLTLCEALAEKYGAADERGRGDYGDFTKWRFPRTEISCTSHRFGLGITYRRREPGAEVEDDKL